MNELKLLVSETEAFEDGAGPMERSKPGVSKVRKVHFKRGEI